MSGGLWKSAASCHTHNQAFGDQFFHGVTHGHEATS
jgi:hypothetical protein